MPVHSLKTVQLIPASMEETWSFFSDPANLQQITPPSTNFKIVSLHHGTKMYAGQIIEYTLTPLFNIRVNWMTEITHVSHHSYFIDEQRFGPYRFWHHQHHFKQTADGIEMTDLVHYKIPFGFIGSIAHWLFVKKQLQEIFHYRYRVVEQKWGA